MFMIIIIRSRIIYQVKLQLKPPLKHLADNDLRNFSETKSEQFQ